ncbi:MAG: CPBP family intramembrane metalloprotease [Chloroflexi bacterium]|nr:CPBP family intramembrane metalloprotease [Chloroflexota bacterium]
MKMEFVLKEQFSKIAYIIAIILFGAVVNYFTWTKDGERTNNLLFLFIITVVLLYLPLLLFTRYTDWAVKEFGFILNGATLAISGVLIFLGLFVSMTWFPIDFLSSALVVVGLVGEELFFRGFVYALVLRFFTNGSGIAARLGAVFLSSLAFALVHTQTFLPDNSDTMWQIFLIALFLAFIRSLSGSILPGIILHIFFNTGEFASVVLGTAIYGLFVFWSHRRGEVESYTYLD